MIRDFMKKRREKQQAKKRAEEVAWQNDLTPVLTQIDEVRQQLVKAGIISDIGERLLKMQSIQEAGFDKIENSKQSILERIDNQSYQATDRQYTTSLFGAAGGFVGVLFAAAVIPSALITGLAIGTGAVLVGGGVAYLGRRSENKARDSLEGNTGKYSFFTTLHGSLQYVSRATQYA